MAEVRPFDNSPMISNLRDGEELEETSSNLTVASLAVADQGNYSCAGRNPIGIGESDLIFLDITG